jgi:hypothetical protein
MNTPSRHLLLRKRFWLGILILVASAALGFNEFGWFGLVMGLIIGGVFSQGLIQSVKSSKHH